METKKLVKTLTFGLGTMSGYDKQSGEFLVLDEDSRKKIYNNLSRCFYDFAKLCNYTTALYYSQRILHVPLKEMGYSKSYTQIIEKMNLNTPLASRVLNQAHNLAETHFSGDHGRSLMKGERVLSTHRADGIHPIYFHKDATELKKKDKKYYICYNIFSVEWAKANDLPHWIGFEIKIKDRDKTGIEQLERVVNNTWQKGSVQLARNRRSRSKYGKYLTRISVKYEPDPFKNLSRDTIMGVDLGVNAPAVIHFRTKGKPFDWELIVGNGRDMLMARRIVSGEIKRIVRGLKKKDSPIQGPARTAALAKLKELRNRERRIMKTAAQKIAATIAEQAKRHGAGIWQFEKIDKTIKDDKPFLTRYWAPGMLVDAVKWQAAQLNADLVFIDPNKTSQRCSQCGHIDKLNRPKGKKKAAFFECTSCGHKSDADKNAARNISTPDIEKIISAKLQEMKCAL